MFPSTLRLRICRTLLALCVAAWSLSSGNVLAQLNVSVVVEPQQNGNLTVAHTAPPFNGGNDGAKLAIMLRVTNMEATPITLQTAVVSFVGAPFVAAKLYEVNQTIAANATANVHLQNDPTLPNVAAHIAMPFPTPIQAEIELTFAESRVPTTVFRQLAKHLNDTPTGSYLFPGKAGDLAAGEFWRGASSITSTHNGSQRFAHDMGVIRWDSTSESWRSFSGSGAANSDYYVWEKPVYAGADGIISAAVDGRDDILPGALPVDNGNYVELQCDSEIVRYYHLRKNSIVVAQGQAVSEGDLLGEVGNSGNTSSPHLHFDVVSASGSFLRPFHFHGADVVSLTVLDPQNTSAAPWWSLQIHALPLPVNGESNAIQPTSACPIEDMMGRQTILRKATSLLRAGWDKAQRTRDLLPGLRRFRDVVLNASEEGRQLTALYYKHGDEVKAILQANPELAIRTLELLLDAYPEIESASNSASRTVCLKSRSYVSGLQIINELKARSSDALRTDLDAVRKLATERARADGAKVTLQFKTVPSVAILSSNPSSSQ